MVPKIADVTGFAAWAATASVLVLLACSTVPEAQQPAAEMAPAESAPAAAPKNGAAPPAINNVPTTSECKGLEEKPCRKNRECVWIIPKEADKGGQIRAAYCRKHGGAKANAKDSAPPTAASPDAPQ